MNKQIQQQNLRELARLTQEDIDHATKYGYNPFE